MTNSKILGQKVPIHEIPCHGNCGSEEHLVFINFRRVSVCILNRLITFGFLRLHMLQGSFEYAWGNFSFLQSNIIKIAQVQCHLKLVCE